MNRIITGFATYSLYSVSEQVELCLFDCEQYSYEHLKCPVLMPVNQDEDVISCYIPRKSDVLVWNSSQHGSAGGKQQAS
jgi:hypothetical protein